jgi:hypothetical protein
MNPTETLLTPAQVLALFWNQITFGKKEPDDADFQYYCELCAALKEIPVINYTLPLQYEETEMMFI